MRALNTQELAQVAGGTLCTPWSLPKISFSYCKPVAPVACAPVASAGTTAAAGSDWMNNGSAYLDPRYSGSTKPTTTTTTTTSCVRPTYSRCG